MTETRNPNTTATAGLSSHHMVSSNDLELGAWNAYLRGQAAHIEAGVPGSDHEGRDVLIVNGKPVAFALRDGVSA